MKIINWGIIGLGNIAHEFSKAFAETKNAKLVPMILNQVRIRNIQVDRPEKDWEKDKGRAVI